LENGTHTLQLKIDWCTSSKETFIIETSKVTQAFCASCEKKRMFGEIISITLKKNVYMDLKIIEK